MAFTVRVAMVRPAAAFMPTGRMTFARTAHTATLLLDGRVLIAGGGSASAELYDPSSQTFTATGSMTLAQDARSATLLANSTLPKVPGPLPQNSTIPRVAGLPRPAA